MKFRKQIFIGCMFLSAALFISGIYILDGLNRKYSQSHDRLSKVKHDYIFNGSSTVREGPVNLIVLGLDGDEVRSDVILLINYDPSEAILNILSIPRDTRVYNKGRRTKINALIAMGGERLVIDMIEKMTGLHIDYYLTLNFTGFRKIIDTLDGVEFDVPFDMNYDDPDQNLHIHLKKGRQILDGEKSEQLVRYRKGNRKGEGYEDGDIGRVKMQQNFLKALIQQKVKLRYVRKMDDIFLILRDYLSTNIRLGEIRYYLKFFKDINSNNLNAFTIPGKSVYLNGSYYFIHDHNEVERIINDNFFR